MNSEFTNDIENIICKINLLNSSINIEKTHIDKIDNPIKIEKTNINSNYNLEQHKSKQKYLNYKRNLKKYPLGHTENYNTFESMDKLSSFLTNNEYKKKWNRLDNYQKKIKIKEYIDSLIKNGELLLENKNELYIQLEILLNKKKLKNVNYDLELCYIVNMKILEFSKGNYKFLISI
jgi:hypothetical protein